MVDPLKISKTTFSIGVMSSLIIALMVLIAIWTKIRFDPRLVYSLFFILFCSAGLHFFSRKNIALQYKANMQKS